MMDTTNLDLDSMDMAVDIERIEDTIRGLITHYRQELDDYAIEMIENGMTTDIICKDLKTYRRDIE